MIDQFKRQAEQLMSAAKDGRIPENVQAFAEESVARGREAFGKLSAAAKDQARAAEEVVLASQAGAKVIGGKLIDNTVANTEAAFDAAQAIAKAKSLPEAARLQAEFVQRQLAAAGAQTQELFDLSTRIARQTFETVSAATAKSFEQMKKAG